jgi:hypothetical protein
LISSSNHIIKTNIVLDRLHFENINCDSAVVTMTLWQIDRQKQFDVGIFNSVFVNITRALDISIIRFSSIPFSKYLVNLHNNTFNITHSIFGKEGPVYLSGGSYHFSSCRSIL